MENHRGGVVRGKIWPTTGCYGESAWLDEDLEAMGKALAVCSVMLFSTQSRSGMEFVMDTVRK
jgi:hypothetical protein